MKTMAALVSAVLLPRFLVIFLIASTATVVWQAGLPAADLPPALVAQFTKSVQPLLLNKCAAGSCHGGPTAHEPRFHRGDSAGRIDRTITLANIGVLTDSVGPSSDPAALLAIISARHPASAGPTDLTAGALRPIERSTLEAWLQSARRLSATKHRADGMLSTTNPATPTATIVTQPPNRFRAMLDAAANPLPLPPPQKPQGIILGKDASTLDE
jgi:hypothetical protein